MYFMTVQTLVLAQQGDTACIQQLFNYCNDFINNQNSVVKSCFFKRTIGLHSYLTLDDARQDLLIASVDKIIRFFDHSLLGNDVEAYIGQAIKFCAKNWLKNKYTKTYNPHNISVDGSLKILKYASNISTINNEAMEAKYFDAFKDGSWTPEQEFYYKDLCDRLTVMVTDYFSSKKIGSGLSYKISLDQYLMVYKLLFEGENKKDIATKTGIQIKIISRFTLNVLNPLVLLTVDDPGIYKYYLGKLCPEALKLVKNKKGIDFLRSYGL